MAAMDPILFYGKVIVILTDFAHVADIFNTYYASIAEYESESDSIDNLAFSELIEKHYTHESIDLIRSKISFTCAFIFNFTSPEIFAKYIDKLQSNKAVGYDDLKASFIKNISPSVMQLSLRTI